MATTPTLAQCQQKKYDFTNANRSDRTLVNFQGAIPVPVLTSAGEQEFARLHPDCATVISSCALPWEPGGSGAYQILYTGLPENPNEYTWTTEEDRQAWINAHPNCGPYPSPVAEVQARDARFAPVPTQSIWERTPGVVKVLGGAALIGGGIWLGVKLLRS